uniref:Uncharacterized protein n=1 Tax=Anguilla anguilla TaxID=7936 RepID=A0A0E9XYW5_ANGAN
MDSNLAEVKLAGINIKIFI